jgi:hypothetical protein
MQYGVEEAATGGFARVDALLSSDRSTREPNAFKEIDILPHRGEVVR